MEISDTSTGRLVNIDGMMIITNDMRSVTKYGED